MKTQESDKTIKGIANVPEEKLVVIKSNPLTSLWRSDMTLNEFKILDVYLARINNHKPEQRQVIVTKDEFESVFGISKFNLKELDIRLQHLVGQAVKIIDRDYAKGFAWISLFEEARVELDEYGIQNIYLECTQKAMKYFFNCDNVGYLRYQLRSVKNMKSRYTYVLFLYLEKNRFRKRWTIGLDDLKIYLNCENDETYKQFKHFNDKILKKCQAEIHEKTECRFEYEPVRKGRRVMEIRFEVHPLHQLETANTEPVILETTYANPETIPDDIIKDTSLLSDAVNDEFSDAEMEEIFAIICTMDIPEFMNDIDLGRFHYLKEKYAALNAEAERKRITNQKPIINRYKYFRKLIQNDKLNKT